MLTACCSGTSALSHGCGGPALVGSYHPVQPPMQPVSYEMALHHAYSKINVNSRKSSGISQ